MIVYVPKPGKDGKRRYGKWAGRPDGELEHEAYCVAEVGGDRMTRGQCSRYRGHGRDKLFCKQHAKGTLRP
jgi:hypothetical protein